jgi:O-antigen ligase
VLEIGIFLGWDNLKARFETVFQDNMSGRLVLYENVRQMAKDHPLFGTGPGTFTTLYSFYRPSPTDPWEAYAHNDWLELRVTFGWIGFCLILLLLILIPLHWLWGAGLQAHWILGASILLALGGCLVHARFDFPFRVYSVIFLFILLCSVMTCGGLRAWSGQQDHGPQTTRPCNGGRRVS